MSIWAATFPQAVGNDGEPPPAARRYMPGPPEIYFVKAIDNSRLVKAADPRLRREMKIFTVTLAVLFALVMVYVLQHFSAIEYGYKIEALRVQRDSLAEANRALKLEEASLRNPERIDALAKTMGLQMPHAGQVQSMDMSAAEGGLVMAQATGISVLSAPN
jgi:cell division protein FtsL